VIYWLEGYKHYTKKAVFGRPNVISGVLKWPAKTIGYFRRQEDITKNNIIFGAQGLAAQNCLVIFTDFICLAAENQKRQKL
jgi:hypothetical protein